MEGICIFFIIIVTDRAWANVPKSRPSLVLLTVRKYCKVWHPVCPEWSDGHGRTRKIITGKEERP